MGYCLFTDCLDKKLEIDFEGLVIDSLYSLDSYQHSALGKTSMKHLYTAHITYTLSGLEMYFGIKLC